MAYTIEAAREQVLEHLDDRSGARYARVSGVPSFKYVDRALSSAVDRCMRDYVEAGGDRFDERVTVTTSATDGTVSLSPYAPLKIRGVLYSPVPVPPTPPTYISSRVMPGDPLSGFRPDLSARILTLILVRRFEIPAAPLTTDLLVGTVSGAARSDDAFDQWVCCRAALQLGIKDDEMRKALMATLQDLEKSIIGEPRNPQTLPWGSERTRRSSLMGLPFQWLYTQRTQTLSLVTGGLNR